MSGGIPVESSPTGPLLKRDFNWRTLRGIRTSRTDHRLMKNVFFRRGKNGWTGKLNKTSGAHTPKNCQVPLMLCREIAVLKWGRQTQNSNSNYQQFGASSENGGRKQQRDENYLRLHHTMVTPMQTTAMPSQRWRLMRSPRKILAPKAPAA